MDLRDNPEDDTFRQEVLPGCATTWSESSPRSAGAAGPGETYRLRRAPALGAGARRGRLDVPGLARRVRRPGRVARPAGHLPRGIRAGRGARPGQPHGEELLGPTLIAFGSAEQQERFLPAILSRPRAVVPGLLRAQCRLRSGQRPDPAVLVGRRVRWLITGQKVWTSLAHWADWCFVVCRTEPGSQRHRGLSYLLVPLRQPGIEIRPIVQLTGTSEFNEVFFDGARTGRETSSAGSATVGGSPWAPWPSSAACPRLAQRSASSGSSTISSSRPGPTADGRPRAPPAARRFLDRAADHALQRPPGLTGLEAGAPGPEASISKLYWATWHRAMANLAMDVGAAMVAPAPLRARRHPAAVSVHPGRHHLRRIQRDPAQRDRRTGPRPAPGAGPGESRYRLASTGSTDESTGYHGANALPTHLPRHPRPRFAEASRCWSRRRRAPESGSRRLPGRRGGGRRCVLSDRHERRLGESVEALSAAGQRSRSWYPLRRHRAGDVDRLFAEAAEGTVGWTWWSTTPAWAAPPTWST